MSVQSSFLSPQPLLLPLACVALARETFFVPRRLRETKRVLGTRMSNPTFVIFSRSPRIFLGQPHFANKFVRLVLQSVFETSRHRVSAVVSIIYPKCQNNKNKMDDRKIPGHWRKWLSYQGLDRWIKAATCCHSYCRQQYCQQFRIQPPPQIVLREYWIWRNANNSRFHGLIAFLICITM